MTLSPEIPTPAHTSGSPSPSKNRPFWTIAQERWNCCILTIHRLIKAGKLKPHRIARMVRISQTELERFEREAQA